MNYSAEVTGKIIKSERENRGWSQKKLGDKLGVSGKQISNYESGALMPPMDILIKLCEVYECELGFLLNEESYSDGTKLMTAIKDKLGIDSDSVNALTHITGREKSCVSFGYESENNRRILNMFLSSPAFGYFYECLSDLDRMVEQRKKVWEDLESKYSKELLDQAFVYYNSTIDYLHDPNAEKLDDIMYEIMYAIDGAIDKDCESTYPIKVARYELNEAFESLINSIYPKKE
ncbi:MAG: helix-turn-helix domain-containing protein [Lachnospiraceae bacterium]